MAITANDCPIIDKGLGRDVANQLNDLYGISPDMTSKILLRAGKSLGSDGFDTVDKILNDEGFKKSLAIATGIGKPAIVTDKEVYEKLNDLYNSYVEAGFIAEDGFLTISGMQNLDFLSQYLGPHGKKRSLFMPSILHTWQDARGILHAYAARPQLMKDNTADKTGGVLTAPTSSQTINIYAGENENTELSNMAVRPFTIKLYSKNGKKELQLYSVEQGFQLAKMINLQNLLKANNSKASIAAAERITPIIDKLMIEKNPFAASKLGKTRIPTRSPEVKQLIDDFFGEKKWDFFGVTEEWNSAGAKVMENLIRESFKQNPEARQKLIETGNATLTHKQAGAPWNTRFPEILMKIRSEFTTGYQTNSMPEFNSESENTPTKPTPKLRGQMKFRYGNYKRADISSETTLDAIIKGERTATTRYDDDGHIDYWQKANTGDIIEFYDDNGRSVLVEVTKALTKLNPDLDVEEWSRKEGWSREYFEKNVRPKISHAYQIEYKPLFDAELPIDTIAEKERQRIKQTLDNLAPNELTDVAEFLSLDPSAKAHNKAMIVEAFEDNLKEQFERDAERAKENEDDSPQVAFRRKFANKNMLTHLAESLVRNMSTIVNQLQDDEKVNGEYPNAKRILGQYYDKFKATDFTQVDRKEILLDNELFEIIRNRAARMLFSRRTENPEMQKYFDMFFGEKTKDVDNRTLLLQYGRGLLRRNERVKILEDGSKSIQSEQDKAKMTEAINDDDDIKTDEERMEEERYLDGMSSDYESNDHYKMADDIRSASDKITQRIKVMLSQISDVQLVDGEYKTPTDPYGLGTPMYIEEGRAINTLLNVLTGADSIDIMINRLKDNTDAFPWFNFIVQRIEKHENESVSREKLRNEFFSSMRKDKTIFTGTMLIKQEDGTFKTHYVERNRGAGSRQNKTNLVAQFDAKEGLSFFKFHLINYGDPSFLFALHNLNPTIITTVNTGGEEKQTLLQRMGKKRVSNLTTRLAQLYKQDREELYLGVDPDIDLDDTDKTSDFYAIFKTMRDFGIDITGKAFYAMAMADMRSGRDDFRQTNIGRIMNDLFMIAKSMESFRDIEYYNPMEYHPEIHNAISVYSPYSEILDIVGSFTESATESMAYVDHRAHYAFNYPTFIQSTIAKLSGQYVTPQELNDFYAKRYDNDWYSYIVTKTDPLTGKETQERHYYLDILEQLKQNGNIGNLEYMQKLDCDGIDYKKMSPKTYALSILSDYFNQRDRETAVYRAPIASDKPAMDTIRWRRIHNRTNSDANYRTVIGNQVWAITMQEINRSRRVLMDALSSKAPIDNYSIKFKKEEFEAQHKVVMDKMLKHDVQVSDLFVDGKYIYADSGVGFKQVRFMQTLLSEGFTFGDKEIDAEFSAFRKAVVDAIFNSDSKITSFGTLFQELFDEIMLRKVESNVNYLKEIGLLDTVKNERMFIEEGDIIDADGRSYAYKYKYLNSILQEYFYDTRESGQKMPEDLDLMEDLFKDMISEFVYNNYIMQIQMCELFGVDLAYYNGTTDFQKRMAQSRSTGQKLNKLATIYGKRVSDGYFRTLTVKSVVHKTAYETDEVRKVLEQYVAQIKNAKEREAFRKSIPDIIKLYQKNDATDGQAINCLSSLRKKHIMAAKWTYSKDDKLIGEMQDGKIFLNENSDTDEAVYQRIMIGHPLHKDFFHVFTQIDKPFVYDVSMRNGLPVPVQQKNAEYTQVIVNQFTSKYTPNDPMSILIQFMEDTHRISPLKWEKQVAGIDTINFESAIKVGNSKAVDMTAETAQLKAQLRTALYGGPMNTEHNTRYDNSFVTTIDVDSYSYQQNNPEHFVDHRQLLGSQMKILSVINTNDDDMFDFSAQKTFKEILKDSQLAKRLGITLSDDSHISGKVLKQVYFNLLTERTKLAEAILRDNLHLYNKKNEWLRMVGKKLESTMSMDSKYNADDIRAVRVFNNDFILAAEDPAQSTNIKAATASWVKKAMYKQEILGGPLVQATNFGKNRKLKTVFVNGKFSHFETIITMPKQIKRLLQQKDGAISERFFDYENNEWKFQEIVNELRSLGSLDMLNILLYRIPSEGKYSIFPCKVVGFAKPGGGSIVELPDVGTTIAGFDFDTDKLFGVMKEYLTPNDEDKKPIEYTPNARSIRGKMVGYNNAVFDMQWLSLTSEQSASEIFDPGNFQDLTDLSFRIELMRARNSDSTNRYDIDDIFEMTPDELKAEWTKLNDMDPADLETMVKLHDQNMSSKEMLGIAAVANISHAQLGMFVNQSEDSNTMNLDSKKIKQVLPEGIRIVLRWYEKGADSPTEVDLADLNGEKDLNVVNIDERTNIQGHLISKYLRKYVGAAADAAKNPTLSRLGADKATFPIIQWMLRARVPMELSHLYTSLPVFRQLSMTYKSMSDGGNVSIDSAINNLERQIFYENRYSKANVFGDIPNVETYINSAFYNMDGSRVPITITIDEDQCLPWIYHNDMNPFEQIHALEEFRILSDLSQKLTTLSNYGRINSVIAGPKPTIEENETIRDRVDKAEALFIGKNPDFIGLTFGDLQRLMPYETQMYKSTLGLLDAIQGPLFPSYQSESYNQILSVLSNIAGHELSPEMKMRVNEAQKLYALSLSARDLGGQEFIMMYDDEDIKKFFVDFPNNYVKRLKDLKNKNIGLEDDLNKNYLLQFIGDPTPPTADCPIATLNTSIFSANEDLKYKISQAWQGLIYYQNDELSSEDVQEVHKLGLDLFRYFTLRTRGKGFDTKTPWHLAPLDIKTLIPGYNDRLKNIQSYVVPAGEFALQFVLNNIEKSELVDFIPEENLAQYLDGYVPNSASGEMKIRPEYFLSDDKDILRLFDIRLGDEPIMRIYPIKNIGKDRVIIFGNEDDILRGYVEIPLYNIKDENGNVTGTIMKNPIQYKVYHRLGIPGVIAEYYPYLRNSIYQGMELNGKNPELLNSDNEENQLYSYDMRNRYINVRADLLGVNVNQILLEEASRLGYNTESTFTLNPINSRVSSVKAGNMMKLHDKALLEALGFKFDEDSKEQRDIVKSLLKSIRERLSDIC